MTNNFKRNFGTITTICFAIAMLTYHITFPKQPQPKTTDVEIYNSIPENYFGNFQPQYEVSINKDIAKLSYIEISKNKLSLTGFETVKAKLLKNGWRIVHQSQYYYQFCHGDKIYLSVLYPTEKSEYDKNGSKVNFTNINQWFLSLNYSANGINHCVEA